VYENYLKGKQIEWKDTVKEKKRKEKKRKEKKRKRKQKREYLMEVVVAGSAWSPL
jgi:hypothetical protein